MTFILHAGFRYKALDGVRLDCGCEFVDVYYRQTEVMNGLDGEEVNDIVILDSNKNPILQFSDRPDD
jgi:hypothetical protein